MDVCFSYLIQMGGLRMLDWRSACAEGAVPADVLFVGPEGTRAHYGSLLRAVRPRLVIPVHWDDLFRPLSKGVRPYFRPVRRAFPPLQRVDLNRFKGTVERLAPGTRVLVPAIFRAYNLGHGRFDAELRQER